MKREIRFLGILLALYLLTGLSYIGATPCMEKPDEEDHYGYLRYVRDHRHLPPLAPQEKWLFESKQPPLYYVLAALVTAPLRDVADPDVLIVQNPYMDLSVPGYREDNRNAYLHPPAMTPVIFGARCVSLLFGLGMVLSVYALARLVVPHNLPFALAVAAAVGFHPMALFIVTSVSNDAPTAFFATLTVTLLIYRQRRGASRYFPLIMGLVLGLGALIKVSALVFCPLVALSLLIIRQRIDAGLLKELALIGLVTLAVGGWWYMRNALVYHDPFTLNAHLARTAQSRPLADYIWQDLRDIERTFWGNLARVFVSQTWLDRVGVGWGRISGGIVLVAAWRQRRQLARRAGDIALLALWPATFGVLLLGFWTRQANWAWGRFLLPGLGPLMFLLLLGWYTLLPARWRTWGAASAAGGVVIIGMLAPWVNIIPLYRPYTAPKVIAYPVNLTLQDADGMPIAKLLGYSLPQVVAAPGHYAPVEICWEALSHSIKPLTEFVQWLDLTPTLAGMPPAVVGGRNTYPGLGNLPTTRWPLGKQFCDRVMVQVTEDVSTPLGAALEVGLWNPETGERLRYVTSDGNVVNWMTFKGIAIVDETARRAAVQRALYTFDGQIQLHDLTQRRVGDSLILTSTWMVSRPPAYDAVLFVHAQTAQGETIAQADRQPLDGRFPTSYWQPGYVVTDTLTLSVPADTPVTLTLGLYTLPDVMRLPLVDAAGVNVRDNALRMASGE